MNKSGEAPKGIEGSKKVKKKKEISQEELFEILEPIAKKAAERSSKATKELASMSKAEIMLRVLSVMLKPTALAKEQTKQEIPSEADQTSEHIDPLISRASCDSFSSIFDKLSTGDSDLSEELISGISGQSLGLEFPLDTSAFSSSGVKRELEITPFSSVNYDSEDHEVVRYQGKGKKPKRRP